MSKHVAGQKRESQLIIPSFPALLPKEKAKNCPFNVKQKILLKCTGNEASVFLLVHYVCFLVNYILAKKATGYQCVFLKFTYNSATELKDIKLKSTAVCACSLLRLGIATLRGWACCVRLGFREMLPV